MEKTIINTRVEFEKNSDGADIANRPILEELIKDIIKGVVLAVWMRDQNRLDKKLVLY